MFDFMLLCPSVVYVKSGGEPFAPLVSNAATRHIAFRSIV